MWRKLVYWEIKRKKTGNSSKFKKKKIEDSGKLVYIHESIPGVESSAQIKARFRNKMKVKL